ncbi:hypothetical protein ACLKA6_007283 [Drosophila palustris]
MLQGQRFGHSLHAPTFEDRRLTHLEALRTRGLSRRSSRAKSAIKAVGLQTSQSFLCSLIQRLLFSDTLPAAQVLSAAAQVQPPASQVQPPAVYDSEYSDMEDDLDDFYDLVPLL